MSEHKIYRVRARAMLARIILHEGLQSSRGGSIYPYNDLDARPGPTILGRTDQVSMYSRLVGPAGVQTLAAICRVDVIIAWEKSNLYIYMDCWRCSLKLTPHIVHCARCLGRITTFPDAVAYSCGRWFSLMCGV